MTALLPCCLEPEARIILPSSILHLIFLRLRSLYQPKQPTKNPLNKPSTTLPLPYYFLYHDAKTTGTSPLRLHPAIDHQTNQPPTGPPPSPANQPPNTLAVRPRPPSLRLRRHIPPVAPVPALRVARQAAAIAAASTHLRVLGERPQLAAGEPLCARVPPTRSPAAAG